MYNLYKYTVHSHAFEIVDALSRVTLSYFLQSLILIVPLLHDVQVVVI